MPVKPNLDELSDCRRLSTYPNVAPLARGGRYQPQILLMQQVARETWVAYERRLERAEIPAPQRPGYHKWTRFYLDFCHKYGYPPRASGSLEPFLNKLVAKKQSAEATQQPTARQGCIKFVIPAWGGRDVSPKRPWLGGDGRLGEASLPEFDAALAAR